MEETAILEGKVKFFDSTKGFGFIKANDGKDYFVHVSNINGNVLNTDDEVSFEIIEGRK